MMSKQTPAPMILVLMIVFSCFAMAETEPRTGFEGVITISPIHGGPARIGVPNSRPLANTAFIVKKGDETVASFTTDDRGRFRISLPPDHYTVSIKDGKGGIGRHGPFEVEVTAGQMKQVEWTCDSGMR
jgi:hypothetical protein